MTQSTVFIDKCSWALVWKKQVMVGGEKEVCPAWLLSCGENQTTRVSISSTKNHSTVSANEINIHTSCSSCLRRPTWRWCLTLNSCSTHSVKAELASIHNGNEIHVTSVHAGKQAYKRLEINTVIGVCKRLTKQARVKRPKDQKSKIQKKQNTDLKSQWGEAGMLDTNFKDKLLKSEGNTRYIHGGG